MRALPHLHGYPVARVVAHFVQHQYGIGIGVQSPTGILDVDPVRAVAVHAVVHQRRPQHSKIRPHVDPVARVVAHHVVPQIQDQVRIARVDVQPIRGAAVDRVPAQPVYRVAVVGRAVVIEPPRRAVVRVRRAAPRGVHRVAVKHQFVAAAAARIHVYAVQARPRNLVPRHAPLHEGVTVPAVDVQPAASDPAHDVARQTQRQLRAASRVHVDPVPAQLPQRAVLDHRRSAHRARLAVVHARPRVFHHGVAHLQLAAVHHPDPLPVPSRLVRRVARQRHRTARRARYHQPASVHNQLRPRRVRTAALIVVQGLNLDQGTLRYREGDTGRDANVACDEVGIGIVPGFVLVNVTRVQDHCLGVGRPQTGYLEKTENEDPFVSKTHRIPSSLNFVFYYYFLI